MVRQVDCLFDRPNVGQSLTRKQLAMSSPHDLTKSKSTDEKNPQQPEPSKQKRQELNALIGKHVLLTVGQPPELFRVQVRRLWDDHYRVNLFVGPDATAVRVAHSYFLVADSEGNILNTTPRLAKHY